MREMGRHLLLDADGVIADLDVQRDALNKATGKTLTESDWSTYALDELYGLSQSEITEIFTKYDIISNALPLPGAMRALHELSKAFNLHIVTHRGWHPEAFGLTQQWFERHNLFYDTLTIVEFGESKSEAYKSIAPSFEALVEDSLSNLEDAEKSGVVSQSILIEQPWNQSGWEKYKDGSSRFKGLLYAARHLAHPALQKSPRSLLAS